MVNPVSGAAGIYHYPSCEIGKGGHVQTVLEKMAREVAPTECHVVFGVSTIGGAFDMGTGAATDPEYSALLAGLRKALGSGVSLEQRPAATAGRIGKASVRIAAGSVVIGVTQPEGGIEHASVLAAANNTMVHMAMEDEALKAPKKSANNPKGSTFPCCVIL